MDCHSSTYACRDGIENRFPVVQLLGTAINLIYRFNLHMHYNQLISILTGSGYSMDGNITFIFIAQMDKSMVKWKLYPGQKQLHYAANTHLALCKHLDRQHANAKLAS